MQVCSGLLGNENPVQRSRQQANVPWKSICIAIGNADHLSNACGLRRPSSARSERCDIGIINSLQGFHANRFRNCRLRGLRISCSNHLHLPIRRNGGNCTRRHGGCALSHKQSKHRQQRHSQGNATGSRKQYFSARANETENPVVCHDATSAMCEVVNNP